MMMSNTVFLIPVVGIILQDISFSVGSQCFGQPMNHIFGSSQHGFYCPWYRNLIRHIPIEEDLCPTPNRHRKNKNCLSDKECPKDSYCCFSICHGITRCYNPSINEWTGRISEISFKRPCSFIETNKTMPETTVPPIDKEAAITIETNKTMPETTVPPIDKAATITNATVKPTHTNIEVLQLAIESSLHNSTRNSSLITNEERHDFNNQWSTQEEHHSSNVNNQWSTQEEHHSSNVNNQWSTQEDHHSSNVNNQWSTQEEHHSSDANFTGSIIRESESSDIPVTVKSMSTEGPSVITSTTEALSDYSEDLYDQISKTNLTDEDGKFLAEEDV